MKVKQPWQSAELALALGTALQKALASEAYREGAQRISRLMRAHRQTPAEKAAGAPGLALQQQGQP